MHMDIKLLQCFVSLAERLNFGTTAADLNMTQPTLSARIKKLEDDLGLDLFLRTTRKVELTRFGQDLLAPATELVAMHRAFEGRVSDLARQYKGTVRIGMPFYNTTLPERESLFRDFELECSNVSATMSYGFKQQLLANLESGRIDLALLIAYPVPRSVFALEQMVVDNCELIVPDDLPHVTLATRKVMLAVPQGHALSRQGVIRREQLAGERIAMLDPKHGSSFTKPIFALLQEVGAKVEVPLEAHDIAVERYVRSHGIPGFTVGWFHPTDGSDGVTYHEVEGLDLTTCLQLVRSNEYPNAAMTRLWRAAERFAARNAPAEPREGPAPAEVALAQ